MKMMNEYLSKLTKTWLLATLIIAVCLVRPSNAEHSVDETQHSCSVTVASKKILELTNLSRSNARKCGRKKHRRTHALELDCALSNMANKHAIELHQRGVLSHQSADGSSLSDRANKLGIAWQALAENIADGYKHADAVHNSWLNSPPHCKNIMNKKHTTLGAAEHNDVWVVVFATQ